MENQDPENIIDLTQLNQTQKAIGKRLKQHKAPDFQ